MITPAVVNSVLQVIATTPLSPTSIQDILPSDEQLRNALTPTPANWSPFLKAYLKNAIQPLFDKPGIHDLLAKIIRKEGDLPGFVRKLPIDLDPNVLKVNKTKATVDFLDYKLYGDSIIKAGNQRVLTDNIKRGYEIARDYFGPNATLPALTDLDTIVSVMKLLRAFEGCLIRVLAAKQAADATGSTLAEVLTFYRMEGDLVAPSSKSTLDLNIPPIETGFSYFLQEGAKYKPNLSGGVWLTEKEDLKLMYKTDAADFIRVRCLIDWFLVTIGFDALEKFLIKKGNRDADFLTQLFGAFSAVTWNTSGVDPKVDINKGKQRFTDLLSNLELQETPQNNKTVLKVVTLDPVKQISMMLTEGLVFMKALPKFAELDYLHYNTQDTLLSDDPKTLFNEDPNKDKFVKIIISAFHAARKSNDPQFTPIRTYLEGIHFPTKLTDYAKDKKLIDQNPPSTAIISLFKIFVNTVGKDHWGDWQPHRANLSRYNILLDYYQKLMA